MFNLVSQWFESITPTGGGRGVTAERACLDYFFSDRCDPTPSGNSRRVQIFCLRSDLNYPRFSLNFIFIGYTIECGSYEKVTMINRAKIFYFKII